MTLEAGIGAKVETAIANNPDKPNFGEVYKDWKNNDNKEENQKERAAINEALHKGKKILPSVSIIDFGTASTASGNVDYVDTYDSGTNKMQRRDLKDFSVKLEKDLTAEMTKKGLNDEQVFQILANDIDNKKDKPTNTSLEEEKSKKKYNSTTDETKTDEKTDVKTEVKSYEIKPGDNLWKIAKTQLNDINKASGDVDKKPSTKDIQDFIQKIHQANQSGDGAIKNIDRIYAGKTLNIPVVKDKAPTQDKTPTTEINPDGTPTPDKTPTPDVVKNTSAVETNPFKAEANTFANPTIGADQAKEEAEVLNKYFDKMSTLDSDASGADYLTADEIKGFVAASKDKTAKVEGEPIPTAQEIAALERAAKHIHRIAGTNDDEVFFESSGATKKDIEGFAEQEKLFEGKYQARFYLDKHFSNLAGDRNSVSVTEIKAYRETLNGDAKNAAELAAIDNLLDQLKRGGYRDGSVVLRANSKQLTQIRNDVGGYSYQEHGGANIRESAPPIDQKQSR